MTYDLVIIGLGYVGLPLAREAARCGMRVAGLDRSEHVVSRLRAGRSHVDDVSDGDLSDMMAAGFEATTNPAVLGSTDAAVICVPTPLSPDGRPDLEAVTTAARTVAARLRRGMLVVLESTTYPGTTDEVLKPILEEPGLRAGSDFHLAFSPERIDPGNLHFGLRNTPKVIGGYTPACTDAAATLYGKLCDELVRAKGTREAEMAKLLENTYRHVNIALVNEMSVFCHELGIDLWDAISCAASKPFGFQPFYPGPGVGGHCIPIDPNYLSYKVRTLGYPFRFVELAQEINARMPSYIASRAVEMLNVQGRALRGAEILLLGVTYKADIADERESPSRGVARELLRRGAVLRFHDPYVSQWQVGDHRVERVTDLEVSMASADLTLLLQAHRMYRADGLTAARLLFDTRGALRRPEVEVL
jgi:UDP-N-acetyl-D-glucosamine dehydrogenase